MAEGKRKASARGPKSKAIGGSQQKTLLHHFQRKIASSNPPPPCEADSDSTTQSPTGSDQSSQEVQEGSSFVPPNAKGDAVADAGAAGGHVDSTGVHVRTDTASQPQDLSPISRKVTDSQAQSSLPTLSSELLVSEHVVDIASEDTSHHMSDTGRSLPSTRLATPISIADSPPASSSRMVSPDITVLGEGGSRDDPIIIEQSPIQSRQEVPFTKPVFPIFASRSHEARNTTPVPSAPRAKAAFPIFVSNKVAGVPAVRSPSRRTRDSEVPWPDAGQQHVRGVQTSFSASELLLGRQDKGKQRALSEDVPMPLPTLNAPVSNGNDRCPLSSCCARYGPTFHTEDMKLFLDTIPLSHRDNYPAISRIIQYLTHNDRDDLRPSSQLWTDRWRPKRADEVLGNEAKALYLRNWLETLALQGSKVDSNFTKEPIDSPSGKKRKSRRKSEKSKEERNAKKPRIQRAVKKSKGRGRRRIDSEDEEDDWIVNTEDETESEQGPLSGSEDDDLEFCRQTLFRLHHQSDTENLIHDRTETHPGVSGLEEDNPLMPHNIPAFHSKLTNTILLAGPSGCGKTAAVYACAEELGWEIFEVYPGIGKRSSTDLDNLVGDVGKNHTLRKGVFRKSADLFTKQTKRRPQAEFTSVDVEGSDLGDQGNSLLSQTVSTSPAPRDEKAKAGSAPPASHEKNEIRQSLVLLEEVDVLYKDDQNFWPAVINFIKDCRRPVVITCNDLSLVPLNELPLQAVLTFVPASTNVTASYLQSLCIAEGFDIDRRGLAELYEPLQRCDGGFPPHNLPVRPDLRSTINQLQFLCSLRAAFKCEVWLKEVEKPEVFGDPAMHVALSRGHHETTSGAVGDGPADSSDAMAELELLKGLAHHTETASILDSTLSRKAWQTPEVLLDRECRSSANDEIGHQILFSGTTTSELVATALYHRDEEMKHEIVHRFQGDLTTGLTLLFESGSSRDRGRDSFDTRSLFHARRAHVSHVVAVLRSILPFSAAFDSTEPGPQVFLDYLPWVRHMVATDDQEEVRESQTVKKGRKTKNSQKYERHISLSEEKRYMLRRSELGMADV